jgi:hypothetical protein
MENLIHPKFRSGTDNPNAPFFYYLINNEIFETLLKMPTKEHKNFHNATMEDELKNWKTTLVKLECSESELDKIKKALGNYYESYYIDITSITMVKDCKVYFKEVKKEKLYTKDEVIALIKKCDFSGLPLEVWIKDNFKEVESESQEDLWIEVRDIIITETSRTRLDVCKSKFTITRK